MFPNFIYVDIQFKNCKISVKPEVFRDLDMLFPLVLDTTGVYYPDFSWLPSDIIDCVSSRIERELLSGMWGSRKPRMSVLLADLHRSGLMRFSENKQVVQPKKILSPIQEAIKILEPSTIPRPTPTSSSEPDLSNRCKFILIFGPNKGKQCGRELYSKSEMYCKPHISGVKPRCKEVVFSRVTRKTSRCSISATDGEYCFNHKKQTELKLGLTHKND